MKQLFMIDFKERDEPVKSSELKEFIDVEYFGDIEVVTMIEKKIVSECVACKGSGQVCASGKEGYTCPVCEGKGKFEKSKWLIQ